MGFMASVAVFIRVFVLFFLIALSHSGFSQLAGYGYGKQITVDASQVIGGSAFTDFPLMVRLTGASTDLDLRTVANGGHVENINGYDIIFTSDQTGSVVLDHQIESYNASSGEYVAWVRVPTLSNSVNTNIFMYYGNCSISVNPSTTSVWNSDFDAVYPLHNDFNDVTSNGYTGTNSGSSDQSPALIADGQTFGVNDYVEIPTSSITTGQGTVSIWAYTSAFTGVEQYMFGHTSNPSGFADRLQLYTDDGAGGLDLGFGNSHSLEEGIVTLNTDEWYYIALTWNGTTCSVYVNGELEHTEAYGGFATLETYLDIGNDGRATGARNEGWNGDLDHARLSNEIFSGNWILTEYNNQRESSTFLSLGTEFNAARTFYSLATGAWETNSSWSFTPDGSSGAVPGGDFPRRSDNAVIQNGHTITINSVTDNGSCSVSPNGLGRSNVGPFAGSGDLMFYHTGDIVISNGGSLVSSEEVMLEGYFLIEDGGSFTATEDIVNLGYMEVSSTAVLSSSTDDLILSGNSYTIINSTVSTNDDIYIDHTDAQLCGEGIVQVGSGAAPPDPEINWNNPGTARLDQLCMGYTVTCMNNCPPGFPMTGTGNFAYGITGPGGVGSTSSSGDVRLWLDANTINQSNSTNVVTWSDQSGYGNDAVAPGGNEPVFNTGQINGFPSVAFTNANSDYMVVSDDTSLDVPTVSLFAVGNINGASTNQAAIIGKLDAWAPSQGYFLGKRGGNEDVQLVMDNIANRSFGGITYGTDVIMAGVYDQVNVELYLNETSQGQDAYATAITASGTDLLIGASDEPISRFLDGDIAEGVVMGRNVNAAERIIIDNYLSAKYAIGIANDFYTRDDPGNGNYDYEVAGIGQTTAGVNHRDAQGRGMVRMWNPSSLDDGDFLIWGHDNGTLSGSTDVDGVTIEERYTRIWSVSETADVGTVSISFNFNGVGNPLGSNLRLLIDRDGDFTTNDVTPIAGTVSGSIARFSGVQFQNGDRFTLGNTDASSPLPVELVMFNASPLSDAIKLNWITASELNNDFFSIERSSDAEQWVSIATMAGAGTTGEENKYEILDYQPINGISYYRLRQTDFDGKVSFSSIEQVYFNGINSIQVFPNPSDGIFHLVNSAQFDVESIRVVNSLGQLVFPYIRKEGDISIDLGQFSNGIYILQVWNGSSLGSFRLVKRN